MGGTLGGRMVRLLAVCVAASLVGALPACEPADDVGGAWGPVLDWGFQAKHAAVLGDGTVLLWSTGENARVWDPATGAFTPVPATFGDLHCAGQATLADGRVIVTGGQMGATHVGIPVTAIFDPATRTWTNARPMGRSRWYPTTTTMADGRVLVTSGDDEHEARVNVPELYDPATDTWTSLPGLDRRQGLYPLMFLLPDGRAYESGPNTTTKIFDVAGTGTMANGPRAPFSTSGYSESAVMYAPGKILRAGGGDPAQAQAAVIDMNAPNPTWRSVAPMAHARRRMNLTLLADGTVIAIGGTNRSDEAKGAVKVAEIFDPATETWRSVDAMAEPRMYHSTAVLLPDGRVLSAGGEVTGARLHAQIYSPPYLFRGPRPEITSAPATAGYGSTFAVGTTDPGSITSVALIRPSAVTHAYDMNQRYVPLAFTATGGALQVTAPASGGIAPPGDYMLVVEGPTGVPSVAEFVRIG